jgi:hypothetical protein
MRVFIQKKRLETDGQKYNFRCENVPRGFSTVSLQGINYTLARMHEILRADFGDTSYTVLEETC